MDHKEKLDEIEALCRLPHKRNSLTAQQVLAIIEGVDLDISTLPRRLRMQDAPSSS